MTEEGTDQDEEQMEIYFIKRREKKQMVNDNSNKNTKLYVKTTKLLGFKKANLKIPTRRTFKMVE